MRIEHTFEVSAGADEVFAALNDLELRRAVPAGRADHRARR